MFQMNKLVNANQMRILEENTFDSGLLPITVMETAAMAVSNYILNNYGICSVAAVCGKGNNGGDGLAAARQLYAAGCNVTVVLPLGEPKTSDAITNFNIIKKLSIPITDEISENADVIVDAIFGIGLSGGTDLDIIDKINHCGKPVVAVDVPSGICSDTGYIHKKAVHADATVTFGYKKTGLTQYPAKGCCGKVTVAPISLIDSDIFDTFEMTSAYFPPMAEDANKGTNGRLLVIAGSTGMTGAATLCCSAALRCGCGLVSLAVPENLNPIMEVKLTEAMTLPLPCKDKITFDAFRSINLSPYTAVVIGPGLGQSSEVAEIVPYLIEKNIPVVIDADGINSIKENIDILKAGKNVILTPHPGEFSRLVNLPIDMVQKNRIALAREFAEKYGVTLVLKGAGTVVALRSGICHINTTGNNGMATGGSGDVLAGIIGAFAARGLPDFVSTSVYLHGLAADLAKEKFVEEAMLPTDITDMLSKAMQRIRN